MLRKLELRGGRKVYKQGLSSTRLLYRRLQSAMSVYDELAISGRVPFCIPILHSVWSGPFKPLRTYSAFHSASNVLVYSGISERARS